jgi:hypothetical protein
MLFGFRRAFFSTGLVAAFLLPSLSQPPAWAGHNFVQHYHFAGPFHYYVPCDQFYGGADLIDRSYDGIANFRVGNWRTWTDIKVYWNGTCDPTTEGHFKDRQITWDHDCVGWEYTASDAPCSYGGRLAVMEKYWNRDGNHRELVWTHIWVDPAELWHTGVGEPRDWEIDLWTLLMHEGGHWCCGDLRRGQDPACSGFSSVIMCQGYDLPWRQLWDEDIASANSAY